MKGIPTINKFISIKHKSNIIHPHTFIFTFSNTNRIPVKIGYWHDLDYYFLLSNDSCLNGYFSKPLTKLSKMEYSYYVTRKGIETLISNKRLIPIYNNLKFI